MVTTLLLIIAVVSAIADILGLYDRGRKFFKAKHRKSKRKTKTERVDDSELVNDKIP